MEYCFDYLNNASKKTMEKINNKSYYSQKDLSYTTVSYGLVLPGRNCCGKCLGGVLQRNNEFVASSAWHEGDIGGAYDIDDIEPEEHDEKVIYIGYLYGLWGHLLTDDLKKIWFLFTNEGKKFLKQGYKIVYISMDNEPLPKYCFDFFSLLGLDLKTWRHITDVSSYENIVIPDNSLFLTKYGRFYTEDYIKIINTIKENVYQLHSGKKCICMPEKIYFTRTKLKSRKDFGEKSIEKQFRKRGYEIVAPEKCSVIEQVWLLMNCKYFATTEGSISHSAIFCQKNTTVVILRKANYINSYQIVINEIGQLRVVYIDVNYTIEKYSKPVWAGPFLLCVTKELDKYMGNNSFRLPYWLHLETWKYLIYLSFLLFKRYIKRVIYR